MDFDIDNSGGSKMLYSVLEYRSKRGERKRDQNL